MIAHALSIVVNELNLHLQQAYNQKLPAVELGNIAEGFRVGATGSGVSQDVLSMSLVNIQEEKTLKNTSSLVRDIPHKKATYENPAVFLNLHILIVAAHSNYTNALLMLSRAIQFFQVRNSFTESSVAPASITTNAPPNALDRLVAFKLIFDLHSPGLEEVNHLWGTLGGKQYPFVLYIVRMLELRFHRVQDAVLIKEGEITYTQLAPSPDAEP
ncbi:DUF4255 domain-containing protein [Pseudomonas sp. NPDC090755]|uniref:DUF4255 domain-containing protein n=1 Tax=Pseudomonas sp. NPDC090755 TaxID=3364481 RepID=UPI00383A6C2C